MHGDLGLCQAIPHPGGSGAVHVGTSNKTGVSAITSGIGNKIQGRKLALIYKAKIPTITVRRVRSETGLS